MAGDQSESERARYKRVIVICVTMFADVANSIDLFKFAA